MFIGCMMTLKEAFHNNVSIEDLATSLAEYTEKAEKKVGLLVNKIMIHTKNLRKPQLLL